MDSAQIADKMVLSRRCCDSDRMRPEEGDE
jgi:hypothetical protein